MNTRILAATLLATSLCLMPVAAAAQDSGLNVGLRGAYSVPFGTGGNGTKLGDLAAGAVPVQVDLDYRVTKDWSVGGYFAYGPALVADPTKRALESAGLSNVSGHAQQALGVQVTRQFGPAGGLTPWVSLAGGYEWTRYADAKLPSGSETEIGRSGFAGTLSLGGSYAVSPRLSVGPYAAIDLGRYRKHLVWVEDGDTSFSDLGEKGMHSWVRLGVKLAWRF